MDGGTTESTGGGRRTIAENLGSLEGWWNASGIALWSFVLVGAFILNATLLLAFLKRPGLRTISNRFVMNLTVSNLLTCAVLNPLLMLDGPSSSGAGSTTCSLAESATALVTSSSIMSVLLIAIDQYLAVVDPLRYRTRIDKLKCAILVLSVWLVSLVFAILAGFNPSPRSLWLVCEKRDDRPVYSSVNYKNNETRNVTLDASLSLIVDSIENHDPADDFNFAEFDDNLDIYENTTGLDGYIQDFVSSSDNTSINELDTNDFTTNYGLVYTFAYALLAYLVPFLGVSWIYVGIYSAAHENSERTRRTGSRPILSSASFAEDYCPVRQDTSSEDFRRIPKISSLSSIDESNETHTPSQTLLPRRGSEFLSNATCQKHQHQQQQQQQQQQTTSTTIEEEESSGVVFTVGSSKVDVTPQQRSIVKTEKRTYDEITKDTCKNVKVPIAILKAQFLDNGELIRKNDDTIKSKFRDESVQKRKSSHDLMYDEMLRFNLTNLRERENVSDDESSVNDDYDDKDVTVIDIQKIINQRDSVIDETLDTTRSTMRDTTLRIDDNPTNLILESRDIQADSGDTRSVPRTIDATLSNVDDNDASFRKNSLDDATYNNPSQSPVLKIPNSLINGKTNGPNFTSFNRTEQSFEHGEHNSCIRNSSGGCFESQGFVPTTTSSGTPIVTITPPNKTSLQRVSSVKSTTSYINSLKHRISNGSLFKYREETRAARISALVIVMGLVCWTPYVIVLILKNIVTLTGKRVSHESDVAAISFMILATYVSPLLFGYRSRRVKRELRKFFCFRRELSYKNNRSLMAKKVLKRRQSGNMSQLEMDARYNIFNCVYGRTRWPKDKVHFVQVPETALVVETCRSSFSSGASTQISSTSTEDC